MTESAIDWEGDADDLGAEPPFRCGDVVFHRPTGERWVVAWAEGDRMSWVGWPEGMADVADCTLITRCSEERHRGMVREVASSNGPRAARVRRLYPDAFEAAGRSLEAELDAAITRAETAGD